MGESGCVVGVKGVRQYTPMPPSGDVSIHLRPTTRDDLDFVLAAEHAPDNARYVAQWPRERHAEAIDRADMAHYIVARTETGAPVGYAIITGIGGESGSVELLRIVITEQGAGHGRAALRMIERLAFETWNAHRLWLDVREQNARARALYASEGFVEEGTLRECGRVGDRYESLVVMSMLDREYRAR